MSQIPNTWRYIYIHRLKPIRPPAPSKYQIILSMKVLPTTSADYVVHSTQSSVQSYTVHCIPRVTSLLVVTMTTILSICQHVVTMTSPSPICQHVSGNHDNPITNTSTCQKTRSKKRRRTRPGV